MKAAQQANEVARASRYGAYAPRLSSDSDRETILAWLQWCDPNGCFTDELGESEGFDPLTLSEAWEAVSAMIADT